MTLPKTVFECLRLLGHDLDFCGVTGQATSAPPGSPSKVEVMRARAEAGESIFNVNDGSCDGLTPAQLEAFQIRFSGYRARTPKAPISFVQPCRVHRKTV